MRATGARRSGGSPPGRAPTWRRWTAGSGACRLCDGVRRRPTTPCLDALKRYADRPIGNYHALPITQAQDKAARTFGSAHTYFVTNDTATFDKVLVQALTRPGDGGLINRNCHKSHHYGLILGGAHVQSMHGYRWVWARPSSGVPVGGSGWPGALPRLWGSF